MTQTIVASPVACAVSDFPRRSRSADALRWLVSMLPLALAFGLQRLFWESIRPFAWFLFYPAVFCSSWIGGLWPGLVTAVVSTALGWYCFIPPEHSMVKEDPKYQAPALVFLLMGAAFAAFHERLRRAQRETGEALEAQREANRELARAKDRITQLYERTRELDELKTQLFAQVSHEFRTPLTLILGPLERLRVEPRIGAAFRHELDVVTRNARTVLRHVNDLLDVARIDAGHLEPRYARVDVARLVRLVAGHFDLLAADRSVSFSIDLPGEVLIECDPELISRVVLNLLSNAFKFTPRGGRVRIAVREREGELVIAVADSGPGVPPDKRTVIFERFRQLDASSARQHGGTGLGLAIVHELVRLHRGSTSVSDAPEGGALFEVRLPVHAPTGAPVAAGANTDMGAGAAQAADELAEPHPPPEESRNGNGRKGLGTVLVVEDNADLRAFIRDALAPTYRVCTAENGARALALALELLPDLVLTDVMMPGSSGDELVRAIRRQSALDGTPIMVLTARTEDELRVRLLEEGASDYLTKPFSLQELKARVGNLVGRHRAEAETQKLARQIDAVARANMAVSDAVAAMPEAEVDSVLQTIAMQAQALTGAELAAVGIGDDPGTPFSPWVQVGFPAEAAAAIGHPPRPVGTLGAVARGSDTVRVADVRAHPAFVGLPEGHPPVRSLLGVPVRYHGRSVGNLYLANKRQSPEFSEADQRLVEMMAARVGAAIETAHLYASLGREHAWLAAVVDTMPEPVVLVDRATDRVVYNGAALALAGISADAAPRSRADPQIDLRGPGGESAPWETTPLGRALLDGATVSRWEAVVHRPDGSRIPVLVSAAPVSGGAARDRTGAVAVFQDISLSKELQRLREDWMAVVAHDLRQPISALAMTADELADSLSPALSPDDAAGIARLRSIATRLNRMVGDLLDVSQIEAGHLRIEPHPADLMPLVRESVAGSGPALKGRSIRIDAVEDPPRVLVDAGRIEQVLGNLLVNAGKYGEPGTEITVQIEKLPDEVRVSVTNRGKGIPPDELGEVFERFYRAREVSRGKAGGLGLGLFIVKGIVGAHGGRVSVKSEPGRETTFSFTVPIAPGVPGS